MRARDALRAARRFVAERYPEYRDCYIEIALEEDGERRKSWSFGVHVDREDPLYDPKRNNDFTGYVLSGGTVTGIY